MVNQIKWPDNNAVCDTDEQWAGRSMLRTAFQELGKPRELDYSGPHLTVEIIRHDRPLYWFLNSPETDGRIHFPVELAWKQVKCAQAFLEANGFQVSNEHEPFDDSFDNKPWVETDLIRAYGNDTTGEGHYTSNGLIVALPHMHRKIWNAVRFNHDEYKF